ncbi:MAG: 50S ribosomal protein L3 [Verrucomicrobia bacterium]|nr:50S ribosomal protein L3 [Verrucomicrobiota bacterium]MBS0635953.1 50S ribosomal protein L3 [Verrucomicrobiota bacterium]
MTKSLMGRKRGMTQVFDDKGNVVTCTVIHAEPNVITQIKTDENDGYKALQLAFEEVRVNDPRTIANRVSKPLVGHFQKAGVAPSKFLFESRQDDLSNFQVGQKLDVALFEGEKFVDVSGVSIGKGYQGTIKKYNYAGGCASHGSGHHRHAGSTGMRSTPGRCFPGGPRPSHMGAERVTVQNLRVVAIDVENNVILVEGAVPGAKNAIVVVKNAVKKQQTAKKK